MDGFYNTSLPVFLFKMVDQNVSYSLIFARNTIQRARFGPFFQFLAIPVNITFFFFQLQVAAKAGEEIKLQVSYRNELFAALNVNF